MGSPATLVLPDARLDLGIVTAPETQRWPKVWLRKSGASRTGGSLVTVGQSEVSPSQPCWDEGSWHCPQNAHDDPATCLSASVFSLKARPRAAGAAHAGAGPRRRRSGGSSPRTDASSWQQRHCRWRQPPWRRPRSRPCPSALRSAPPAGPPWPGRHRLPDSSGSTPP